MQSMGVPALLVGLGENPQHKVLERSQPMRLSNDTKKASNRSADFADRPNNGPTAMKAHKKAVQLVC